MKRYIFFIAIILSWMICLAPSRKRSKASPKVLSEETILQGKINTIAQSIGKSFNFSHGLSLEELSENYINWCKKLSKNEMIKILYKQEQLYGGFNQDDALNLVDKLNHRQPSTVYDFFIRYQRKFVLPNIQGQQRSMHDRIHILHQFYKEENDNQLFLRRLPLIHNIETHLLPDITNLTDQQLYEKIAKEMKKIGFSQNMIQDEVNNLKTHSVGVLQAKFPHLQDELAQRLLYFNDTKKEARDYLVNVDYYLALMHAWVTTAASIMVSGASLFGLSPLALQSVANSYLLNPYVTQKQNISKRQMLAMIYAQYKSYDALQDVYLDPHFKEAELLTKSEILSSIHENMIKIGCDKDFILQQMNKYKELKKGELLIMEEEFKYLGKNYQDLDMSEDEKKIAGYTKADLVREIENYLSKFSISEEEKEELLDDVEKENKNFAKVILLDLMKAATDQKSLDEEYVQMPHLSTTKEQLIIKSPKIISDAIGEHVIGNLQRDWQQEGKSQMYQIWRTKVLRSKLEQKEEGAVEHILDLYNRGNVAKSIKSFK